jgi:hypothetical protein
MTTSNSCHLEGVVQAYSLYGDNWTRYNRHQRGQVRFWLGVSRELAGDGLDVLLCAIEPKDADELRHYQEEIRGGRTLQLQAHAKAIQQTDMPGESMPGVIFVAESCGFDGREAHPVHHKHKPIGKMAAAGDDSGAELPLNP